MATNDRQFTGSIPEVYDRLLVPLIFEPYARELAERIAGLAPRDVLEVAAGTGVVTRALAARLPRTARILATDLNQPMLDHARARSAADTQITWMQADALALPFEDGRFDAVACQFGAMFFPDKVKAYGEACRVLRRGGRFLFNVWDEIGRNAFADIVTHALAELFPDDPPRFLARTPHGYNDAETIRAELGAAGFGAITIEAVEAIAHAPSPEQPAAAFCQGTPLRGEIEARGGSLDAATRHAAAALAARFGTGPIDGPIRALVVTAAR